MKVLITGGAGFIGSNLVKGYLEKGYEVVVVDNFTTGKIENMNQSATYYEVDVCSPEFLEIVEKEKPDLINHHAAQIDVQTSIKKPLYDANINIIGTLNVLEACRKVNCGVIYASSAAVYGTPQYLGIDENHPVKPISTYGISKHTPEHYIELYHHLYNIPYMILRYANVYGEMQDPKGEGGVISILVDRALSGERFTVFGDGEQTRDFIHVEDVVIANILASVHLKCEIVNIGTGIATSLNNTIELMEEVIGKSIVKSYGEERKGDIKHNFLLNDKAKKVLNWAPKINLKEGLRRTYNFYNLS